MKNRFIFFCVALVGIWGSLPSSLEGSYVLDTCYGSMEIQEPVIVELLESPAMQRLKGVYQYGVLKYLTHTESYTRWDHSVGVFALLRLNGASLEEQVAGLLHDVSHTAFSHFGDYFFHAESLQDSYQDSIHSWFLQTFGIEEILTRHGFDLDQADPKCGRYQALEQELPNLCADRLDYNLQGAYHRGWISRNELRQTLSHIRYHKGRWVISDPEAAALLGEFSLHMTTGCWGAAFNSLVNEWLGKAVERALSIGELSFMDITFGQDDDLWERLHQSPDDEVRRWLRYLRDVERYYQIVPLGHDQVRFKSKFRGIDPWVETPDGIQRLTEVNPTYRRRYEGVQALMEEGWSLQIHVLATVEG